MAGGGLRIYLIGFWLELRPITQGTAPLWPVDCVRG